MRFESGYFKKERDGKKEKGEELNFFEKYEESLQPGIDKILEKRKHEEEDRQVRQNERLEKLKEEEKKGKLVIKKI
ncbi:MAG: hypothetical protein BWY51_00610 [Parcubacteria group bacterium ADurb.Bin316]|nr:MAG: hypothetical protein BWY51_00610 [Parcubacteria group bacterium ADurb.Bin316]HOZ56323.1 hypothetical protein [bacterium]